MSIVDSIHINFSQAGINKMSKGTLFVVATPIGNLDDLSPRARETLEQVELVAAEDTRVTGRLLSNFGISARMMALFDHNEEKTVSELIKALDSGNSVALVSDAGTPLISDPGFRLVRAAHGAGITVSPVPGPSSAVAALSVSGLASDRFVFEGFLPPRRAARKRRLAELKSERRTLLFFESVHRVGETLVDLVEVFGPGRQGFIGRELSKLYEQCVAAPLVELAGLITDGDIPRKGEFVVGVAGETPETSGDMEMSDALLRELAAVLPGKQAVDIVARVTGNSRNRVYRQMLVLKNEKS